MDKAWNLLYSMAPEISMHLKHAAEVHRKKINYNLFLFHD